MNHVQITNILTMFLANASVLPANAQITITGIQESATVSPSIASAQLDSGSISIHFLAYAWFSLAPQVRTGTLKNAYANAALMINALKDASSTHPRAVASAFTSSHQLQSTTSPCKTAKNISVHFAPMLTVSLLTSMKSKIDAFAECKIFSQITRLSTS